MRCVCVLAPESTLCAPNVLPVLRYTCCSLNSVFSRDVHFSWTMDLDDLERKASSSSAKVLLLSHMRGKVRRFTATPKGRFNRAAQPDSEPDKNPQSSTL